MNKVEHGSIMDSFLFDLNKEKNLFYECFFIKYIDNKRELINLIPLAEKIILHNIYSSKCLIFTANF